MKDIQNIRKEYTQKTIEEESLSDDPIKEFEKWFRNAQSSNQPEPNAMTLATTTSNGQPSARIVLLKGVEPEGFVFYTNYLSRKGKEIAENPKGALNFFWVMLEQQIRIEGEIQKISVQESTEYYQQRDRDSRIGAWASPQSTRIENREFLEQKVEEIRLRFSNQEVFPKPDFWGGYILIPHYIEFWQGRASRLHDRIVYEKQHNQWVKYRIAP